MASFLTSLSQLQAKLQVLSVVLIGLLLPLYLSVAPAHATGVYDFPLKPATGDWVIDEADILSRLTEGTVSGTLDNLAKQTGNEVRLVTIHRLDYGETIESFTNQLFEKWFPSSDEQANQTLLVLDNVTNTTAIRTGDTVKTIMPDEIAHSVAQETLLAPLRKGNKYNQAFTDAGDRLVAVLSGQPDPGPPVIVANIQTEGTFATPEETKESNATVWVIGLLLAATVIPMATYYLYQILQS
ncbi:MAG: TPM domain-containing protein [Oculatellaceae cyanobacterium bins.114]|nr:TPM domain-containing protein [Oculatellaceae cyanobacterium bins.114]